MKISQNLRDEHEGVLDSLRILEKMCDNPPDALPVRDLERLFEFFRVFVDRCHHGKEEDLLFPALEAAGVPRNGGPIGVLLEEHRKGRGFVKAMAKGLEKIKAGDGKAAADVIASAREYAGLLRRHVEKENSAVFPMADSRIPETRQKELMEGFEEIEEKRVGHGKHEEFHEMLHALREIYLE